MNGNALVHYIKYLVGLDVPETQTTDQERQIISKYAKNARLCVEIGVFEGVNTITIAQAMHPDGTMFGIDPFFKGRLGICYYEKIVRRAINKRRLGDKVKLLPLLSYNAIDQINDNIDFIFIDGDHSFEGLKRDWEDWTRKLTIGGIIALHDTSIPPHDLSVENLGSYKFYNEVIVKDRFFKNLETVDSLNVLQKIK